MYDIIGDIHGCATLLKKLLTKMGYQETQDGFQHPERKVIFLGDYIDRGLEIVETLTLVSKMVTNKQAIALMGNHEYNFICMQTPTKKNDKFLHDHTPKNCTQISKTMAQLHRSGQSVNDWVKWMRDLPLALELPGIKCVHASWDVSTIEQLRTSLDEGFKMNEDFLVASAPAFQEGEKKTAEFNMIERVLKGPEIDLPKGMQYEDKDGFARHSARLKWWVKKDSKKRPHEYIFTEAVKNEEDFINEFNQNCRTTDLGVPQSQDPDTPVFFGHYWLKPPLKPLSPTTACLDSSAVKTHTLTAYRFTGEKQLVKDHFVTAE